MLVRCLVLSVQDQVRVSIHDKPPHPLKVTVQSHHTGGHPTYGPVLGNSGWKSMGGKVGLWIRGYKNGMMPGMIGTVGFLLAS